MITLYPQEKIIRIVHRHWIVVAGKMTTIALLFLIPLFASLFSSILPDNAFFTPFLLYGISIYTLILAVFAFSLWVDYYLDIWIITNQRIIDIEQKGIFAREISEFMLERVQDVTIKQHSFIEMTLKYGTIQIHTAGEKSFTAHDLPNVEEIKNIIIAEKMRTQQNKDGEQS